MSKMIDKQKLLEWLLNEKVWKSWDDYCEITKELESGRFDVKEDTNDTEGV